MSDKKDGKGPGSNHETALNRQGGKSGGGSGRQKSGDRHVVGLTLTTPPPPKPKGK